MSVATTLVRTRAPIAVVGVKQNPTVVASLRVGDPVLVVAQPTNPVDSNAFQVLTADGQPIGYIPAALAARLAVEEGPAAFDGHISETRSWEDVVTGASVILDRQRTEPAQD